MALQGWPLTGIGQISPRIAYHVLNSIPVSNQQQFRTSVLPYKQDILSGDFNNLVNAMLSRNDSCGKAGQMKVPVRNTAELQRGVPERQTAEDEKITMQKMPGQKLVNMIQSAEQQQYVKLMQQQLHEDGKDTEMEKTKDNAESFLSHEYDNADTVSGPSSNFQQHSATCNINGQKRLSLEEVGSLRASVKKILCCNFSSDGKFLASAGEDKKVVLWSMTNFDFVQTGEEHSDLITDVRFRPCSTIFATSSFDTTVQIWDSKKHGESLSELLGHTGKVTSLDFHPRNVDLLCSCDINDEIRLWNISQCACTRIFRGARRQVRFQPPDGKLLAAASGNVIIICDVENYNLVYYLEGHVRDILSICWDKSGNYIASVSKDRARVWSVVLNGKCIYELHADAHEFNLCTFHPRYSKVLAIGCSKSLVLWNPSKCSKSWKVAAHGDVISALASCPDSELIASAGGDQIVKVWR